jgi:hypothetical protein
MAEPIPIVMYADLACPYAYVSAYRVRKLRDEYRGKIVIAHKSLVLEYVNREPTPKPILEQELPLLVQEEPGILYQPYQPWQRPESEWPVTMLVMGLHAFLLVSARDLFKGFVHFENVTERPRNARSILL